MFNCGNSAGPPSRVGPGVSSSIVTATTRLPSPISNMRASTGRTRCRSTSQQSAMQAIYLHGKRLTVGRSMALRHLVTPRWTPPSLSSCGPTFVSYERPTIPACRHDLWPHFLEYPARQLLRAWKRAADDETQEARPIQRAAHLHAARSHKGCNFCTPLPWLLMALVGSA